MSAVLPLSAAPGDSRRRVIVTPEGLALGFTLGSRTARAGALALDLAMIGAVMIGTTLALVMLAGALSIDLGRLGRRAAGGRDAAMQTLGIVWFLAMFLMRHGWFLGFELGPRGATPGKRIAGLRVAARDGGRLTTEAVLARNLLRDIELFLPVVFLGRAWSDGGDTEFAGWAGLAWISIFLLFPLFNRDRLRCGDVIAGTWVVEAPRRKLEKALSLGAEARGTSSETGAAYAFSDVELAHYGEYELKILESVLRDGNVEALRQVAETIARKIGWDAGAGDERAFLSAYYTQLRARLERGMRFGRRKANKRADTGAATG